MRYKRDAVPCTESSQKGRTPSLNDPELRLYPCTVGAAMVAAVRLPVWWSAIHAGVSELVGVPYWGPYDKGILLFGGGGGGSLLGVLLIMESYCLGVSIRGPCKGILLSWGGKGKPSKKEKDESIFRV